MAWLDSDMGDFIGKQPAAPAAPVNPTPVFDTGPSDVFTRAAARGPGHTATYGAPLVGPPPPSSGGYPASPSAPSAAPSSFDSNPGVAAARALENQGISQLDSWLKSAREQAIIQSGDPALASMAGFGLDPQAGVFARQNYLSGNADLARVDRAKKQAHQAILNRLAARGLLRSGDLGYLSGEANIDFGNQEYDVRQNILGKLAQFMREYLEKKQGLKMSTLSAYQDAYRNADLDSYGGGSGGAAGDPPVFTVRDRLRWER